LNKLPEELPEKLDSQEMRSDLTLTLALSFSMFMDKIKILLLVFIKKRKKKTWELVIKV